MDQPVPLSPIHAPRHAVQFYGNESSLYTTVAGFLSEGMVAGQPAIILATESHRTAIVEQLAGRLIDVAQAQRTGDLVLLDAQECLSTFMVGDLPNANLFEESLGGIIEKSLRGRPRIVARAYGEMVDLLWQEGRADAAIRLEILWNKLATRYGFALLCGYSMGHFYKQADKFRETCDLHTHVLDPEPNVVMLASKRAAK